jgi:hypothetical protein
MKTAANGRWLDAAILGLLLAASPLLHLTLIARSSERATTDAVAVLFAPWVGAETAMQRVAAAGARIVRFGALPFIIVVEPEGEEFRTRIAERGALAILDPVALAACLPRSGALR